MSKRTVSPSNIELLALVGLAGLLTVVLALAAGMHAQDKRFRESVYDRCVARAVYDSASQDARRAQVDWYREQIRIEGGNDVAATEVREARIRSAQAAIAKLEAAIAASVPGSCDTYKS